MKLKRILAGSLAMSMVLSASALTTVFASPYSQLQVIDYIDDKGAVAHYNIVTDINGLKGITDKNGTVIMDIVYYDIQILPNWNKFAVQKKDGKWSIIDISGTKYLSNTYDFVDTQYCDKGYLIVGNYGANQYSNKAGVVDKSMNLIVEPQYQSYIYTEKDGLLLAKSTGDSYDYYKLNEDNTLTDLVTLKGYLTSNSDNYYYINAIKSLKEYDADTESYSIGYITTIGLADLNYNTIIEPIYENSTFSYYNNLAIVKYGSTQYESKTTGKVGNGKYGIIDPVGNVIVQCEYDSITRTGTNYTFTLNGEKTTLTANALYSKNEDDILTLVNGVALNTESQPIIENGYTLLPLREIAQALNAEVSWNDNTKTAILTKDDITAEITINSNTMKINDRVVTISTPAEIINNTTYIPVRSLSVAMGCKINWDSQYKVISITA